jgi:hypothetical protein
MARHSSATSPARISVSELAGLEVASEAVAAKARAANQVIERRESQSIKRKTPGEGRQGGACKAAILEIEMRLVARGSASPRRNLGRGFEPRTWRCGSRLRAKQLAGGGIRLEEATTQPAAPTPPEETSVEEKGPVAPKAIKIDGEGSCRTHGPSDEASLPVFALAQQEAP